MHARNVSAQAPRVDFRALLPRYLPLATMVVVLIPSGVAGGAAQAKTLKRLRKAGTQSARLVLRKLRHVYALSGR